MSSCDYKDELDTDPVLKAFTLLYVFDFPEGLSSIMKVTLCQGYLSILAGWTITVTSHYTASFLVAKYILHRWPIL